MASTIVMTSPHAGSLKIATTGLVDKYYLNLKGATVFGSTPFLADGTTNNPDARVTIGFPNSSNSLNIKMSDITSIGGSATPASLSATLAAVATLIAE